MVFSSSARVYGNPAKFPVEETFPLHTLNPYGETKIGTERILRDLQFSDPEWRIVILRYLNPIGAHASGLIGEDPVGLPKNIMPYLTQEALGKRESLWIYGGDYPTVDRTGVRDYIHIADLAKGHVKALEYLNNNKGFEVFNPGTGKGYSVLELIQVLSAATSIRIPYQIVDRRPGDIGVCYANPKKANMLLGWRSEKNLMDMCRDAWNWQLKNPNGYSGQVMQKNFLFEEGSLNQQFAEKI